jgi:hypothetical protein
MRKSKLTDSLSQGLERCMVAGKRKPPRRNDLNQLGCLIPGTIHTAISGSWLTKDGKNSVGWHPALNT